MNRPTQLHVVRDVELALALMAAVAFAFAVMLGAVAPAAGGPEARVVPTDDCERDDPGLAIRAEPPTLEASCRTAREVSLRAPSTTERAGGGGRTAPITHPGQAILPTRPDFT